MSQMEDGKHKKKDGDGLPRLPEKFALAGHRNHVTSIKFHPHYSQVHRIIPVNSPRFVDNGLAGERVRRRHHQDLGL